MSPAASFLSNFGSLSRKASVASSNGRGGGAAAGKAREPNWPAFASVLPPGGDEAGFVIKTRRAEVRLPASARKLEKAREVRVGEEEQEDEWILGAELGRGGMGLVREARLSRPPPSPPSPVSVAEKEKVDSRRAGSDDVEVKVAVKIIPRRRVASRSSHSHPQHPHHHSSEAAKHPSLHPTPHPTPPPSPPQPPSSSLAPDPTPPPLPNRLRDLSHSRILSLERARSTSSPIRPSLACRSRTTPNQSAAPTPVGSRRGTPLPSPGLIEGVEMGLSSAPGEEQSVLAARAAAEEDGQGEEAASQEPPGEEDLLDLLLQRELDLWQQLSALSLAASEGAGGSGKKHIVPLLGLHRTPDFDYVFMPLASGGTLLSFLTAPRPPPAPPSSHPSSASTSTSRDRSTSASRHSRSRSRLRHTAAGKSVPPPSHSHIHNPKPRRSLAFAGPGVSAAKAVADPPRGFPLQQAGTIFVQVAEALRWLHEEAGVSHRDVKLENIVGCFEEREVESGEESESGKEELEEAQERRRARKQEKAREEEREREGRGRSRKIKQGGTNSADPSPAPSPAVSPSRRPMEGGGEGAKEARSKKKKKKKSVVVWKLADFGLAEIIPASLPPSSTSNNSLAVPSSSSASLGVKGVQPLAALARAASLSRPTGYQRGSSGKKDGSGPEQDREQDQEEVKPKPLASSAFLPSPHHQSHRSPPTPSSTLPPTSSSSSVAATAAADNSPLSALYHPVGSLPYSSPEALVSPFPILLPSVDVWALGCVLYALVEGRLPIWEEWELRMRVRLVKGEWEVPDALAPSAPTGEGGGKEEEEREDEKRKVLEVLKGCLEKDVEKRWTTKQVVESEWLRGVKQREEGAQEQRKREARERRVQRGRQREMGAFVAEEGEDSVESEPTLPPSRGRSRGRQVSRPLGCPPALSAGTSTDNVHLPPSSSSSSLSPSRRGMSKSKSRSRSRVPPPPSPSSASHHQRHSISRSRSRSSASLHLSLTPSHSFLSSSQHSHSAHSSAFATPAEEEEHFVRSEGEREERRMRWEEEEREAQGRRRSRSRARGVAGWT